MFPQAAMVTTSSHPSRGKRLRATLTAARPSGLPTPSSAAFTQSISPAHVSTAPASTRRPQRAGVYVWGGWTRGGVARREASRLLDERPIRHRTDAPPAVASRAAALRSGAYRVFTRKRAFLVKSSETPSVRPSARTSISGRPVDELQERPQELVAYILRGATG